MTSRSEPEKERVSTDWTHLLQTNNHPVPTRIALQDCVDSTIACSYDGFVVENFLTADECDALISASECIGYWHIVDQAPDVRGNLRLQIHDTGLFTSLLYERVKSLLPPDVDLYHATRTSIGLNDHWRMARYEKGDHFKLHSDNCAWIDEDCQSCYTVNIYLNDNFTGGNTRFYDEERRLLFQITPRKGRALVFRQPPTQRYLHDGEIVQSGVKYLLRTDIMYREACTV